MAKDTKYFNFPIQLLNGFLDSDEQTNKCLLNISNYAIYEHSLKLTNDYELERITISSKWFGLDPYNCQTILERGKELFDSIPLKSPKTGVNLSIWWDFYKNDKTEFEKVCLLGFLAIKSIVQKKACCKTNNKLWLLRMDGKTECNELIELSSNIEKYNNEYQTKKIKTELQLNWGLVSYSYKTRGFYISFKMKKTDLVYYAENKRHTNKVNQLKEQDKLARENALLRIKNNTTTTRTSHL